MPKGWTEVALGDLCRVVVDRRYAAGADGLLYVGLEHMPSGSPRVRDPSTTAGLASQVVAFQPDDVLFGRLRPYLRKVAQADFAGVCSPEILVLRPVAGLVLPSYLYALAASHPVIDWAVSSSAGSRMPRTSAVDLLAFRTALPPLAEQRRIVDLIRSVDEELASAKLVVAATEGTLAAYLDANFSTVEPDPVVPLGALVSMGSGPSWKAADEAADPRDGSKTVIGITSTPAGTRLVDVTQRRHVVGLPPAVRTLMPDSIVLIRTNGNRNRIGNAYRVPHTAVGYAFSAFQIGVFARDPHDATYLFWFLSAPSTQARISDAASGSTGLGNVSVRWLSHLEVPWPAEAQRAHISTLADTLDAMSAAAREVVSMSQAVRDALLADLLSGEHRIPESYDLFLTDAA